jgi:tetratricopeptide (TPR) repeat protein
VRAALLAPFPGGEEGGPRFERWFIYNARRMPPGRRTVLCVALIVLCVLATFGRVVRHEFLYWDDHLTLFQNPDLNPATLAGIAKYWAAEKWDLYIPVTYSLWGALAAVARTPAGLNPAVFHAASVILHAASACLAFAVLRLLCRSDLAACAGALLFALHPVQVEPVAWASGMKDVLCGALSLLAVWQYLLFAQTGRRSLFVMATLAYALATLAKPSAVTLALIAASLDYFLVRHDARKLGPLVLWLALAVPIFLVTRDVQSAAGVYPSPPWMRPVIAWDALAWYLRHLLMPLKLAVDYGRAPQRVWPPAGASVAWWVVAALVAAGACAARRRYPWLPAGLAVFAAALLPVLGFVRFAFQQYSTVADHYLYLAMLGPALILAFLLRGRGAVAFTLAGVAIVALAARSVTQAAHWRDTRTLFSHTLKVNPDSFAANNVLGFLARERGDNLLASVHFHNALVVNPDDPAANFNLARVLLERGDVGAALARFERALASRPHDPHMRNNYGVALARATRWDEAAAQFETVLARFPDYADAQHNLAIVRARATSASQPASRPASHPAP